VGEVVGWSDDKPCVGLQKYPGKTFVARTTVPVPRKVGVEVVLLFEDGSLESPIIVGVIQSGEDSWCEVESTESSIVAQVDEERLVFRAKQEIVLECGESRITLREGRAIIEGAYVETYARGTNRIKGAAVKIN